jgi:two-component system response regulator HydG
VPEPASRVLIIDDQAAHAQSTAEALERAGYECVVATSGQAGLDRIRESANGGFDVIITDLVMRGADGMAVLREVAERTPETPVLMVTGHGTIETAVEAIKAGAYDYIEKPLDIDALRTRVRNAAEHLRLARRARDLQQQLDERFGFEGIVGHSPRLAQVLKTCRQIAPTTARVLIIGESGTGKELVARAIHVNSPRRAKPFVPLNCAALSEGILESELFGHEKGSFTSAAAQRKGRFEYADGGTLFLDEVGDMPLTTQIKLLRVIESGEITRVGSNVPMRVDVRLISATNQDLAAAVARGTFREDLYFRLKVVQLTLPPLRERREDIPLLVDTFIRKFSRKHGKAVTGITPEAVRLLSRCHWPGNVRELENAVESMVVIAAAPVLDVADLPESVTPGPPAAGETQEAASAPMPEEPLNLEDRERRAIVDALARTRGNREEAARLLGIGERTLYRKIKLYDLT